ncbi:MAG TPA: phosphohistidine phosphatase SixA, partial [Gammaproteobacteria bacterium]|nr:phosphohistidine phosphatase SixA [Gammaproteobacteria bacterium]
QVDYFFHSSKLRAQQTAELLSKAIHCARGIEPRQGLAPSDLVSPIASEINQFGHDLVLVGHMPFMGKLLSKLISGYESNDLFLFQTATLVCLENLDNGTWIIRWAICSDF